MRIEKRGISMFATRVRARLSGWALSLALAWVILPSVGRTQDEQLPSGEEVVDRSIEAMGGKAAFEKIKTVIVTAKMEMEAMGIKGTMTSHQARPNKVRTVMELDGIGTIERGYDGDVFWELNPLTGPRIYEGAEKAVMVLLSAFDESEYRERYESIECVGTEEIEGEKCYKVVYTPKSDVKPFATYYSIETGLAVKTEITVVTQMGEIVAEIFPSDYREVDGLLLPHTNIEKTMGMETRITIESIEFDVDVGEDRFDLPEEIEELAG